MEKEIELNDLEDYEWMSECCGADINDMWLCSECREHCC